MSPNIYIAAEHGYNGTKYSNNSHHKSNEYETRVGLNASWSLFNGVSNYNNYKAKKYAALASSKELEDKKREITLNLKNTLVAIKELSNVERHLKNEKDEITSLLANYKKQYSAGRRDINDLLDSYNALYLISIKLIDARYSVYYNKMYLLYLQNKLTSY